MLRGLSSTLEVLNIPKSFQEEIPFNNDLIIYSSEEKNANFSDNKSNSRIYDINIKYCYKTLKNINRYNDVIDLLKSNKYIFKGASDGFENEYYVKYMKFEYENKE